MKAILTGSLANGFSIECIVDDAAAEDIVISKLAIGNLAEALDIASPASIDTSFLAAKDGKSFIVYGRLGDGFEVVGPFSSEDEAFDFEEETIYRTEWSLFVACD